jgi:signal transduction histidine kinase
MRSLFTRFYRAKNDATVAPGTGLGLYLTKYFAEAHGGRVEVESQLNVGSTFKIILPADPLQAGLKTQLWRNDYVQNSGRG